MAAPRSARAPRGDPAPKGATRRLTLHLETWHGLARVAGTAASLAGDPFGLEEALGLLIAYAEGDSAGFEGWLSLQLASAHRAD